MNRYIVIAVVAAGLLATSVAVVLITHKNRILFVQLQGLERERDRLNTEWSQLTLESSALATHDRVEQVATARLQFHVPAPSEMEVAGPNQ